MVNWRTTVSGLIAAALPFLKGILPAGMGPVIDAVQALAIACLGYFAADKAA